jgi:hypothetical protein
MASGDNVVVVLAVMPPDSSYAVEDWRVGATTISENFPVLDFAAAVDRYIDFLCRLEGYGGGGLTLTLPWSASSAITGDVRWGVAVLRWNYDAEDVDVSHTYDFNSVDDTAPGTSGYITNPTVAFTSGADMDSWAEGELALVRIRREGTHANDDMSGDAELWMPRGLET